MPDNPEALAALIAAVNDNFPPSSRTLGTRLVDGDTDQGWIEMTFRMPHRFCDEHGLSHALVTAMLDTTMANVVIFCSRITLSPPTLALEVGFFRSCGPGNFRCRAQYDYRGRSIAFLSAVLRDSEDRPVARASSTVKLIPYRG